MKILLVEDDALMIEVFRTHVSLEIEVVVAQSKTEAEALLTGDYELAVCDLKIPLYNGSFDATTDHGLSILVQLRALNPGMPIFVFSGSSKTLLNGNPEIERLRFFKKSELPECLAAIQSIVTV